MHWAVHMQNKTFVKVLCDLGADADRKDYENLTPRRIAEQMNDKEMLALLPPCQNHKQSGFDGCLFFGFCPGETDAVQLPSRKDASLP